jgi:hypothetical protein
MTEDRAIPVVRSALWYCKFVFACLACGLATLIVVQVAFPWITGNALNARYENWVLGGAAFVLSPLIWRLLR